VEHGAHPVSVLEYLGTSRFWIEPFENWQSEFLAIWAMIVLSIHPRQRASPESKPVAGPHSKTGSEYVRIESAGVLRANLWRLSCGVAAF